MSINEACDFFEPVPKIFRKLKTIQDVGLGYINLGQSSTTLSGGEAQELNLPLNYQKKIQVIHFIFWTNLQQVFTLKILEYF